VNNQKQPTRYDSIIIGAGHNGLVCAAYLAKSGQRVLVLEASDTRLAALPEVESFIPASVHRQPIQSVTFQRKSSATWISNRTVSSWRRRRYQLLG